MLLCFPPQLKSCFAEVIPARGARALFHRDFDHFNWCSDSKQTSVPFVRRVDVCSEAPTCGIIFGLIFRNGLCDSLLMYQQVMSLQRQQEFASVPPHHKGEMWVAEWSMNMKKNNGAGMLMVTAARGSGKKWLVFTIESSCPGWMLWSYVPIRLSPLNPIIDLLWRNWPNFSSINQSINDFKSPYLLAMAIFPCSCRNGGSFAQRKCLENVWTYVF